MLIKMMTPLVYMVLLACHPTDEMNRGGDAAPLPQTAPATHPSPQTHPVPAQPPETIGHLDPPVADDGGPDLDPDVEALLDKLERSAGDLTAFTAKVAYEKQDTVLGRREVRRGDLIYRLEPQTGEKSFAILFETTQVGPRLRNDPQHYVFNGRWLAEIDHANKQFIKREVVPPGKQLDPLKLGEGPFPLPVGQPKAQVLARFDVTKAQLPKEGSLNDLQNVDGLLLVPKANTTEARDFTKVELFYDRQTLLPVGINLIEANGDRKTIKLTEIERNPALDEAALRKLSVEEPDPREWRIDVRPWVDRPQ